MTEYIRSLRQEVGSRPLIQCGASVLLENDRGELLLERRADDDTWCYPGGSVELFEHTEDAARRELLEETGLTAGEMSLYGIFSGPELRHVYPNGDEVSNIDIVYLCRNYTGMLNPQSEEVAELRFFPPDGLPTPLLPPQRGPLAQYVARRLDTEEVFAK